jgi:hypothetical protein
MGEVYQVALVMLRKLEHHFKHMKLLCSGHVEKIKPLSAFTTAPSMCAYIVYTLVAATFHSKQQWWCTACDVVYLQLDCLILFPLTHLIFCQGVLHAASTSN